MQTENLSCGTFEGFDKGKHQLIIPDINDSHHNVIDVMIDNNSENDITKVLYYDSLTKPATRLTCKMTNQPMNQRIHCKPSWSVQ